MAAQNDLVVDPGSVPAVPGYWAYHALQPEQVRWYYLRTPLSLKGYYEQDILHRAHIQRFCTTDSLTLEREFAKQREFLEKLWWEEQAELGARTLPAPKGAGTAPIPDAESASADWQDYFLGKEDEVGLLVRGGLYEVNLRQRRLKACYWPEPSHRVLRGTWFLEKSPDWVPLKEATADELEEAFHSEVWNPGKGRLQPQRVGPVQAARVDLRTLSNEAKGWFALFVSESEAYLCRDDSLSWLSRKLSPGATAPGMRLRRGWEAPAAGVVVQEADLKAEEADEAAAAKPVGKLLLVVHGIGQNLGGSNIVGDAAAVRQNLASLAAEQLGEKERAGGRMEVLPVQWRKHLNLDVDTMADVLMPPGVRSLRMMLHATAVEVLLYLTPLHCQDMLDSLVDSLNLQYHKFLRRNPGFQGEVSILAHSLGSVLSYDILCNQPHLFERVQRGMLGASLPDQLQPLDSHDLDPAQRQEESAVPAVQPVSLGTELEVLRQENARLQRQLAEARQGSPATASIADPHVSPVTVKPLAFAVDCLIAAGSPLGIFLTLRRVNPNKGRGLGSAAAAKLMPGAAAEAGDGLPAVRRLYNLYHPFDPVGFRLEPLVTPGAEKRRPVYAAYYKGGRRLHVGLAELSEDVSAAVSAGAARAASLLSSLKLTGRTASARKLDEPAAVETELSEAEAVEEAGVASASCGTQSAVWRLTEGCSDAATSGRGAKGRLDFVLQAGNVENPWLSAMSSHFCYWASLDVALFVLRAAYGYDVRLGPAKEAATADDAAVPSSAASPASPSTLASPVLSPRTVPPRGLSDPEDWW